MSVTNDFGSKKDLVRLEVNAEVDLQVEHDFGASPGRVKPDELPKKIVPYFWLGDEI